MKASKQTGEPPVVAGEEWLAFEHQLCFPLYASSNLVLRAYGPLLKPLGLTYPQYLIMLLLWQHQQLSVGELGQRLYLDSGTLTPLLKRMADAGLVTRNRSEEDQRRVLIDLTDKGRALKSQAVSVPATMLCRMGGDIEWLKRIKQDLGQLIDIMESADRSN
ncbi:MarR family winged helix-turn-helix transcriptional regulator [Gynuella sunshinyii]|uniref:Transcriptional regulator n=1 Tax=Gynuella sunshinyii YC6258 TaxID=1445510 RepID=A0A0C5VLE7_9GAMM|nr:MarR family transcriptional regulator [Gynuella sunshinyii]AJQ95126.1 transcriptional regulator [Gynuella sunshinyii YC6258]